MIVIKNAVATFNQHHVRAQDDLSCNDAIEKTQVMYMEGTSMHEMRKESALHIDGERYIRPQYASGLWLNNEEKMRPVD